MCLCECIVETVTADDKTEGLLEAYERRRAVYESTSCCDYILRVTVTSWSQQVQQDMQLLVNDKGRLILRPRASNVGRKHKIELNRKYVDAHAHFRLRHRKDLLLLLAKLIYVPNLTKIGRQL